MSSTTYIIQCEALHPVVLDVTKEDQVQKVADQVDKENPQGLYALVNNAGTLHYVFKHVIK